MHEALSSERTITAWSTQRQHSRKAILCLSDDDYNDDDDSDEYEEED